ncbi:MAG: NUDIX domain-containing protein [Patescibacteria group bacterium]
MANIKDRYQVSLKALVTNEHGEVLALNARTDGSFAGYFDLPGGRIDVGEFSVPLLEILRREIQEELGDIQVEIKPAPVAVGRHMIGAESDIGDGAAIHVLYLFFEAKYLSGNIQTSAEHTGFRWLDLSKHRLPDLFKSALLEGVLMYSQQPDRT